MTLRAVVAAAALSGTLLAGCGGSARPAATADPTASESHRLAAEPGVSDAYANCMARVLVFYGADGDKWDALPPTQRQFVDSQVKSQCPAWQYH